MRVIPTRNLLIKLVECFTFASHIWLHGSLCDSNLGLLCNQCQDYRESNRNKHPWWSSMGAYLGR